MSESDRAAVQFRSVNYNLPNGREILSDLTLSAQTGEILVLLGRSGSGKTTALKLVNRLREQSSGEVEVEGRSTREWDVIRLRRQIGYAIQEIGLFPHLTVAGNIGLLPELEKWPQEKTGARVAELLQLVGLGGDLASRYPHQLSGGQRQRVGVARALVADPPILLMDEPFGALDPLTRAELQREFLALQKKLGKTVLFVTHDVHEALFLGTKIALLDQGRLIFCIAPQEFLASQHPLARRYLEAFQTGGQRQA